MKKLLLLSIAICSTAANAQFWTPKAIGVSAVSRGVDDISIVDDNVVWIKTYDGSGDGLQTVKDLSVSVDGGNTWTAKTFGGIGIATSHAMGGITAVSATTAWVAVYPTGNAPGGIWKTINAGTTWTKQSTALFNGAGSFTNLVYFWNENDGFAQGDPDGGYFELYTTTDGGNMWTRVPSANIPAPLAGEYGYVHNYDVVNNTIWFGTNRGRLYKSIDKGLNWTVSQSPLTDFGSAAMSGDYTFSTETKGLLNSSTGLLYISNDGGATWTQMAGTGYSFNSIEYVPGTSKVVATGAASLPYGSYYSYNDGADWLLAEESTQMTTLAFLNETTGFAGGFTTSSTAGGIFKYTGTALPTASFLRNSISLAPNPTTGNLTINSDQNGISHVAVFDMLGKIVYDKSFISVNEASIDITSLSPGAYILKATNDSGAVQTMKVLKN